MKVLFVKYCDGWDNVKKKKLKSYILIAAPFEK